MRHLCGIVVLVFFLLSCSEPQDTPAPTAPPSVDLLPEPTATTTASSLAADYAARGSARITRLEEAIAEMQKSLEDFSSNPTAATLTRLQAAWETSYTAWNQAYLWLVHRALGDPARFAVLRRIDPLPIMPGFVDGLAQWPDSGIVNDPTVALDRQSLLQQQDVTAQGEASIGFQVVEFLLFGAPSQPRNQADFVDPPRDVGAPGLPGVELPQRRRRQYLETVVDILAADMGVLLDAGSGQSFDMQKAIGAAAKTLERIRLIESLAESDDPVETYLAPRAQALALAALQESLAYWKLADSKRLAMDSPALAEMSLLLSGYPQGGQDTDAILASIRALQ